MKEKIAIGKILKAHGTQGNILLHIYSGVLQESTYKEFAIKRGNNEIILQLSNILEYRPSKGMFLATPHTSVDVSWAALCPTEIFVEELPYDSLEEGEFFLRDLEGAKIVTQNKNIGKVLCAHEIAARTVIEVELHENGANASRSPKIVFLPLWEPFLLSIDIPNKLLVFGDIHDFL